MEFLKEYWLYIITFGGLALGALRLIFAIIEQEYRK